MDYNSWNVIPLKEIENSEIVTLIAKNQTPTAKHDKNNTL